MTASLKCKKCGATSATMKCGYCGHISNDLVEFVENYKLLIIIVIIFVIGSFYVVDFFKELRPISAAIIGSIYLICAVLGASFHYIKRIKPVVEKINSARTGNGINLSKEELINLKASTKLPLMFVWGFIAILSLIFFMVSYDESQRSGNQAWTSKSRSSSKQIKNNDQLEFEEYIIKYLELDIQMPFSSREQVEVKRQFDADMKARMGKEVVDWKCMYSSPQIWDPAINTSYGQNTIECVDISADLNKTIYKQNRFILNVPQSKISLDKIYNGDVITFTGSFAPESAIGTEGYNYSRAYGNITYFVNFKVDQLEINGVKYGTRAP
ncbi:hypothetical protein G6671_09195 [Polynucleobacter paneuropaeus]|uniref:Uncharacterized protein n=1 Tax=Polynucleobacter paneuropaeus TaxID=2527775 RepID=A0A9Q2WK07_9BURK|nr:hypothetical protein [Polynucleobacter paneuropaeus]QWD38864.1 hypothetical protein G6671_09195 [Polynucleobacter paneuropaeus]